MWLFLHLHFNYFVLLFTFNLPTLTQEERLCYSCLKHVWLNVIWLAIGRHPSEPVSLVTVRHMTETKLKERFLWTSQLQLVSDRAARFGAPHSLTGVQFNLIVVRGGAVRSPVRFGDGPSTLIHSVSRISLAAMETVSKVLKLVTSDTCTPVYWLFTSYSLGYVLVMD